MALDIGNKIFFTVTMVTISILQNISLREVSKYRVFSGLYFPAFGLNTLRYSVSLRIQPECGKLRTRKNSVFGHFSRKVFQLVLGYS